MKEYEYDHQNPDHHRELADAIDAKNEGCPLQYLDFDIGKWKDRTDKTGGFHPAFRYRRKPTPVARRWNRKSDVPLPICFVRSKNRSGADEYLETMILNRSAIGFEYYAGENRFIRFTDIEKIDMLEHSTDCVNWSDLTTLEP